ncbi:30S ribosomal protein S5 [bacterium]|nr:30S ribosomal protein S5 [bacterium]
MHKDNTKKDNISKEKEKEQIEEAFETKVLEIKRVTRVTAGGKQLRFRAVVVIGNKNGKVGVGVAKGKDVAQAVEKATLKAKKNIIEVPIINDTIPHEVFAKAGAAKVLLRPQKQGRGLVAGGTVRVICQLAGIKNISSKILGATRNKLNNAQAVIKAFQQLKIKQNYATSSDSTKK